MNETLNLDWVQQLPDNFEGDYYVVANMTSNGANTDYSFSNTPIITLTSLNQGMSDFVENINTEQERPSTSFDGNIVAYERSVLGVKQIFFKDVRDSSNPVAVTDGNNHSFSPQVSGNGQVIVFHSRASDLVPDDTNGHEDVFLYVLSTKQTIRVTNSANGVQANGGCFYPSVNFNGNFVAFESEATNLTKSTPGGKQIYLWDRTVSSYGSITALTNGNGESRRPSISDDGHRVVFSSDATNLVGGEADTNGYADVFLYDTFTNFIHRLSKSHLGFQSIGGFSDQPKISGDGTTVAFRSLATNLITGKGISNVSVVTSGAGYYGNPTIVVNDPYGNGEGAVLALFPDAIDLYGQIRSGGIEIINPGYSYTDPQITIIPDPNFPPPVQVASILAHLTHPMGEIYSLDINAFLNGNFSTIRRVSENENGVGGNMPSRDPDISDDGNSIVYATQSSNLFSESNYKIRW